MKINKRSMLINIAKLLAELVAVAMVVIVAPYSEGNPDSARKSDGFRIPEGEQERVEQLRAAVRSFDWDQISEMKA